MAFVVMPYRRLNESGRVLLYENQAHAKSLALLCIRKMMRKLGFDVVETYQCMCCLKTWGTSRSQLVLTNGPTIRLTNSSSIGVELRRKCDGSHNHHPLVDGRARDAVIYSPVLCLAISRGIECVTTASG